MQVLRFDFLSSGLLKLRTFTHSVNLIVKFLQKYGFIVMMNAGVDPDKLAATEVGI